MSDLLTLNFKGNDIIKGVINVTIYDVTGKAIIRFRSASIYRSVQIPVSNLVRGYYIVQVIIMNELVMNQKFLKQ